MKVKELFKKIKKIFNIRKIDKGLTNSETSVIISEVKKASKDVGLNIVMHEVKSLDEKELKEIRLKFNLK